MSKKYTYEEVKNYIEVESNSGCKLISKEYTDSHSKLQLKCECGNLFNTALVYFRGKNKRQCNECGHINQLIKRKFTYQEIKNYIEVESNSGCELVSTEYINSTSKLEIKCRCEEIFITNFAHFKCRNKRQCNKCCSNNKNIPNKLSYNEVRKYIESFNGYKLLSETYKNAISKITLQCPKGHIYDVTYNSFKQGSRCSKCAGRKKLTYEEVKYFIEIESQSGCKLLSTEYINAYGNLQIVCNCGNIFNTNYTNFIKKSWCNKCSSRRRYTYQEIIIKLNKLGYELIDKDFKGTQKKYTTKDSSGYFYKSIMTNLIDSNRNPLRFHKSNPFSIQNIKLFLKLNNKPFELISKEYKTGHSKLKWKCLKDGCGETFEQSLRHVLGNIGCGYCSGFKVGISNCFATKRPDLASQWHPTLNGDLTPYDFTCGATNKIFWVCDKNKNHIWEASVLSRNRGTGCPICSISKGENEIKKYLEDNNFNYKCQYRIKDCRDKYSLPFDFGIFEDTEKTKLKYLIEYDGEQHYAPVKHFGGNSNFIDTQNRDELKNNYCKANNIKLLRVPYWDFENIEQILTKELNTYEKVS